MKSVFLTKILPNLIYQKRPKKAIKKPPASAKSLNTFLSILYHKLLARSNHMLIFGFALASDVPNGGAIGI